MGFPIEAKESHWAWMNQRYLNQVAAGLPSLLAPRPGMNAVEVATIRSSATPAPKVRPSSMLPLGSLEWAQAVIAEGRTDDQFGTALPTPPTPAPTSLSGYVDSVTGGSTPNVGFTSSSTDPLAQQLTLAKSPRAAPAVLLGRAAWWLVKTIGAAIVQIKVASEYDKINFPELVRPGKLEYDIHNNVMLVRFPDKTAVLAPPEFQPWSRKP